MNNSYNLTPRQKAAILIMSLPPELSAQVIRSFPPEEVQSLSIEMSKAPQVPQEIKDSIIKEFLETSELQLSSSSSAPQATHSPMPPRSHEEREELPIRSRRQGKPFAFLSKADPKQVLALIEKEHPQTIALVLSNLTAAQATAILQAIRAPLQAEVARRLADIGKVRPEVLRDVEQVLEERFFHFLDEGFQETDGREALMEILNRTDRATEEKILSGLAKKDPRLAKDLKTQLYEFEDIALLDKFSIQQLLKVTDMRDLVLALKGASPQVAQKIYQAIPEERAQAIKEDVEALKGVSWEEIRAAQQQIRNNLRGLAIIGKIKLPAQGEN
jgi:flagellar motor switch protein FliG